MTRDARKFKDAVYGELARLGKALSSPRRLELLDLLAQGPRTVEALARQIDQSLANTSQHLQVLRAARLVEADRSGVHVVYRLADDRVAALLVTLRELGEARLLEIPALTRDFFDEAEPVDAGALVERARRGEVTVIDVRPEEEYRAGHLEHALSIPLDELERRLREIPKRRPVVAYCRGPWCVMAEQAVERLRARGYRASRMDAGVAELRARGLPVAEQAR